MNCIDLLCNRILLDGPNFEARLQAESGANVNDWTCCVFPGPAQKQKFFSNPMASLNILCNLDRKQAGGACRRPCLASRHTVFTKSDARSYCSQGQHLLTLFLIFLTVIAQVECQA